MSQTSLIEKIKNDTATRVAAIEAESEAAIAAVKEKTEAMLQERAAAHASALEKKKEHLETVALSQARQAGNIALQQAKRNGIDEVFTEVEKEIKEATSAEYVSLFSNIAKDVLPEKAEGVVLAPAKRLEETKEILKNLNVSADVKEDGGVTAGFILNTEDGVYDATLDRVIMELRPRLEIEIIKSL